MQGSYTIFIRSKNGTLIDKINDYVSLHLLMTLNQPGSWDIKSVSAEKCPFDAGTGIIVLRNGAFLFGGVLTEITDTFDATTGLYKWTARGKGDLEYLNRRICYVDPENGTTNIYDHYTATGDLATVVCNLINVNAGQSAMEDRREQIIKNSSQSAILQNVSISLRFQNLLTAVVAISGEKSYNVRAEWDRDLSKVYFSLFKGRDLTGSIVFTEQLNNIIESEYLASAPEGNFILAGGTGEMTERQFVEAYNSESIGEWGRIEVFQDARNQNQIGSYALEVLKKKAADTIGYSCTAAENDTTPQFGTDYKIGDYVGMKIRDQFVTAQVQQCEITVEGGIESIVPRFGTVAIGKFRDIYQKLSDLRQDVNELLGTEVE